MAVGVTDTKIRFTFGSRKLTLDYRKVPFTAWAELKQATGFTPQTLLNGIGMADVEAVVAIIWLERKQRERKVRYHEVALDLEERDDEFEVTQINVNGKNFIPVFDDEDQDVEVEGEDPTSGS